MTGDKEFQKTENLQGKNPSLFLPTPEVDPNQGLVELPDTVVDPTHLIAQNPCKKGLIANLLGLGNANCYRLQVVPPFIFVRKDK